MRNKLSLDDAVRQWVREFNAIPEGIVELLVKHDGEAWREITPVAVGDRVYCYEHSEYGEVAKKIGNKFEVVLDNGKKVRVSKDELEADRYDALPMWGTMWQFGDSIDDWWLNEKGGLEAMAQCGFRIYDHEEYGFFFGIDGCGYDFFEAHWVPLYKARGLQWHNKEEENENTVL